MKITCNTGTRGMNRSLKTLALSVAVLLTAGSLVSCLKEGNGSESSGPSRTLIVYMGGDNNLSMETQQKIEAIRQGWQAGNRQLIIYQDQAGGTPRLLRLRGGCAVTPEPYIETLREYDSENSADPVVFSRVLEEVRRDYPAESYGLLVFSHASGWLPAGALEDPTVRSLIADEGDATAGRREMELTDFAAAIPDGMLDFIVFEMCLMSGAEVMYELRDKADYILASSAEILSPGFTPVYPDAVLGLLDTDRSVGEVLEAFGQRYFDYVNTYQDERRAATLSLIRTGNADALAAVVREILATAGTDVDLSEIQHFDRPGSYGDFPAAPRFFDLEDYLAPVATTAQSERLRSELERTVTWKVATESFMPGQNGFYIRAHSGLTVYVEQGLFPELNDAYHELSWFAATH